LAFRGRGLGYVGVDVYRSGPGGANRGRHKPVVECVQPVQVRNSGYVRYDRVWKDRPALSSFTACSVMPSCQPATRLIINNSSSAWATARRPRRSPTSRTLRVRLPLAVSQRRYSPYMIHGGSMEVGHERPGRLGLSVGVSRTCGLVAPAGGLGYTRTSLPQSILPQTLEHSPIHQQGIHQIDHKHSRAIDLLTYLTMLHFCAHMVYIHICSALTRNS
jgi:hypothetical protein